MNVVGVHHVAIGVNDVDAAIEFYGWLGLEPLPRPDFGFPGAWLGAGSQQVHLLQTDVAPPTAINHYAFQVGDLEECIADLEAHGVTAHRFTNIAGAGLQAFIQDPSGNVIELNQPN